MIAAFNANSDCWAKMIGYSAFCTMWYTLAYLGQENAGKRKFEDLTKMEIEMTNEQRIKGWMEHWEQVRDLAAVKE